MTRLSPEQVRQYALRYGFFDPDLAVAQAYVESRFKTDAKGASGECGIMQMLPSTASGIAGAPITCEQLYDPAKAIALYTRFMNYLYGQSGDIIRAISAYNYGERALRMKSIPNMGYVKKVSDAYKKFTGKSLLKDHNGITFTDIISFNINSSITEIALIVLLAIFTYVLITKVLF